MKILLRALRPFRRLLPAVLGATLCCTAGSLVRIWYAQSVSGFIDGAMNGSISVSALVWAAGLLVAFSALQYLGEYGYERTFLRGGDMLNRINCEATAGMSLENRLTPGDMLNRMNADSADFQSAVSSLVKGSLKTLVATVIALVSLCAICAPLAVVAAVVPVAYNLAVLKASNGCQKQQDEERARLKQLTSFVEDKVSGRHDIRLLRMESAAGRRHEGLLDGWNGVRRRLSLFWSMVGTFDNLLYVGYRVLLVLLGAVFARRGLMRISDLFVFLSMADTFMNFIWDFQAEAYQNAIAAGRKLLELWSCPQERTNGAALQWREGAPIEARDVRYSYDGQRMVLDDLTLSIEAGRHTCITGESGCGKTTLARLICGFLQAQGGSLSVGGADIAQWNPDALRKNMAYMQQETGLIRGNLAENIAWKRAEDITAEDKRRIGEILRFVGLSYLSADAAYDRLEQLSMGERQRVGFARCLFKDAKLWILDEPTSALDEENERAILELMGRCVQRGATLVSVSHRTAVMERADRLLRLEKA